MSDTMHEAVHREISNECGVKAVIIEKILVTWPSAITSCTLDLEIKIYERFEMEVNGKPIAEF